MAPKKSAGLLCYRKRDGNLEVLLIHPGGPYWRNKDFRSWSIPKGLAEEGEEFLHAAIREFCEETGFQLDPDVGMIQLTPIRQANGKIVHAWAFEGDFDVALARSNSFTREWPPGSGEQQKFPEVDRAGWFPLEVARKKIHAGQEPLLLELERLLQTEG